MYLLIDVSSTPTIPNVASFEKVPFPSFQGSFKNNYVLLQNVQSDLFEENKDIQFPCCKPVPLHLVGV